MFEWGKLRDTGIHDERIDFFVPFRDGLEELFDCLKVTGSVRKSDPAPWWPFGESMTDRADHMIGPLRRDSIFASRAATSWRFGLTRDPEAMIKVLALGTMLNGEKFHPDATELHAVEVSAHPHPSFDAREAEIKLTAQDIRQVQQPVRSIRP